MQRRAYIISGLKRKVSTRKLQRYWRTFAEKRQTTRALAIHFVATGVTSLQMPPNEEVRYPQWHVLPCCEAGTACARDFVKGSGRNAADLNDTRLMLVNDSSIVAQNKASLS